MMRPKSAFLQSEECSSWGAEGFKILQIAVN